MTNLSIDPGIARAARIKAVTDGVSLSSVVQQFLEAWTAGDAPPDPENLGVWDTLREERDAALERQRELERRLDDVSGHLQSWRQWAGQVCAALGITDPAQVVPWIRELRATHGSPLPPDKPAEDLAEQENPR